MSIPEQAGKVASTTIEALKTSPALLVLVLLQLTTLGVLFFAGQRREERQQAREIAMIDRCFPLQHPGKE